MAAHDSIINWLQNDLLAFTIAFIITGIVIPKIILIAFRRNLFDEVNERKIHRGVVPRLGGIAFFPAMLFSMLVVIALNIRLGHSEIDAALSGRLMPLFFEICAIILLYLVGIADDLIGVKYRAKFIVQIVSGSLVVCSGFYIGNLYGMLWLHELPMWLSWVLTILAVVFVVNAINLIDGIDGLASGLSTIALIFYAVVFFNGGEYILSMLAAATAGTLFPFFYFNVFGDAKRQKKIFMGDTGALTTGMVLAFCAIAVMCARPDILTVNYNPAIVALSPLIVPCFDVCRVYFHRVKRKRNPFLPDKCHIHHKLLALGMNQAGALLTILGGSLLFIGVNVIISPFTDPNLILVCDVAVWTILNVILTSAIRRRENLLGQKLYD